MKLAVPDLISNSYFPAVAAVELGYFRREGLDVTVELIAPAGRTYEALRGRLKPITFRSPPRRMPASRPFRAGAA